MEVLKENKKQTKKKASAISSSGKDEVSVEKKAKAKAKTVKKSVPSSASSVKVKSTPADSAELLSAFEKKKFLFFVVGVPLFFFVGVLFLYKNFIAVNALEKSGKGLPFVSGSYQVYLSEEYGFTFKYPSSFLDVRKAPDAKACIDNRTWDNAPVQNITVAEIENISVSVSCQKLTDTLVNQFARENDVKKEISLKGRKGYVHDFVTKTGYEWKILQVPLDDSRYLELAYNYTNLPEYKQLSDKEWEKVLNSVSFK